MSSAILMSLVVALAAGPDAGFADARRLWQRGRLGGEQEAYETLLKDTKSLKPAARAKGVLGLADCLASQGEYAKALEAVETLAKEDRENPDLAARAADLQFLRGDWDGAS